MIFTIFFLCTSCSIGKIGYQIDDYYIAENGKEILGTKPLNAFIFENNLRNVPFQQFVAVKYNLNNFLANEIWITINETRFKLIIYEHNEFEKYFGYNNFAAINKETIANVVGNQSVFLAVSLVSDQNEDALNPNSLYYQISTQYLKNLKDEYLNF
ncbi:hypothetical protein [Flavobacterium ichthyis]|nr:hypothetical protein [Flavobacterium ichthyis]